MPATTETEVDIFTAPAPGAGEAQLLALNTVLRARARRLEGFNADLAAECDRLRAENERLRGAGE